MGQKDGKALDLSRKQTFEDGYFNCRRGKKRNKTFIHTLIHSLNKTYQLPKRIWSQSSYILERELSYIFSNAENAK